MPVSNSSCTVVIPVGFTVTVFPCELAIMTGASDAGMIEYVPGKSITVNCP